LAFGDDGGVFLVIRVFGPAVENELLQATSPDSFRTQIGPESRNPAPVSGDAKKIHSAEICAAVFQHASYGAIPRRGSRR